MTYFLAVIGSFFITLFLTPVLVRFAKKRNLISAPRSRDIHQKKTPRLGGIAIVISFLVVMILLAVFASRKTTDFGFPFAVYFISIDKRLLGIILATLILSAVMIYDDLRGVPAYLKFLAQILVGLTLIAAGIGITYLNNPFGLAIELDKVKYPLQIGGDVYHLVLWADLLFLAWTGLLMNATNFIDGLDGLAATLSLLGALILVGISHKVSQPATGLMAGVLAGSIAGFLPYNMPPAKVFLGDTGSMFLGMMLAVLTVISGGKLATLLLVFGLVILDSLYVVAKRIIRRQNPFTTADQTHLHHRFLQAGFSHTSTLILIVAFSLMFGAAGLLLEGKIKLIMVAVLAVVSIFGFVLLDLKRVKTKVKA